MRATQVALVSHKSACMRQVEASRELYPERVMGQHLKRAGVPLKQLHGFMGTLARGEGDNAVITYNDPFAKATGATRTALAYQLV